MTLQSFDVIILGTGLVESICASSCAQKGLSVLHLDTLDSYGQVFQAVSLEQIHSHFSTPLDLNQSRKYNLELSSLLLYAQGPLVKALQDSQVAAYLEFRAIETIHILINQQWETVPLSKEDVFSNDAMTLIEKRRLMKFITTASTTEVDTSDDQTSFHEYLNQLNLSKESVEMIMYALALHDSAEPMSFKEGFEKTKQHVTSLGKYSKSAFLTGIYGTGSELVQGFCRSCAVYGGTYILGCGIDNIQFKDSRFCLRTKEGTEYTSPRIIASSDYHSFFPNMNIKAKSYAFFG